MKRHRLRCAGRIYESRSYLLQGLRKCSRCTSLIAMSSSLRPWIDVFALPEKSNMAVTQLSMRACSWNVTDSKKIRPDYLRAPVAETCFSRWGYLNDRCMAGCVYIVSAKCGHNSTEKCMMSRISPTLFEWIQWSIRVAPLDICGGGGGSVFVDSNLLLPLQENIFLVVNNFFFYVLLKNGTCFYFVKNFFYGHIFNKRFPRLLR